MQCDVHGSFNTFVCTALVNLSVELQTSNALSPQWRSVGFLSFFKKMCAARSSVVVQESSKTKRTARLQF